MAIRFACSSTRFQDSSSFPIVAADPDLAETLLDRLGVRIVEQLDHPPFDDAQDDLELVDSQPRCR